MAGRILQALLKQLRGERTFEDAASRWLEHALEEAGARSPEGMTPLRAMVHLRPEGSYQSLVVREHGVPAGMPPAPPDLLPSTSAWRQLVSDARPVIIDVVRGVSRLVGAAPGESLPDLQLAKSRTLNQLRDRQTSLLIALPLLSQSERLLGAASVEMHVSTALPPDPVVDEMATCLQDLADLLALILPGLPARPAEGRAPDALLPVVGARMARLVRLLEIFAQQDETLLLSGPTGSGKSQLAAWCHARSGVAVGPFETVVLSTLPEDMQLPSLFGWRKGAFTGAHKDTPGAVARAAGGTLFIDEIDKLSPKAQSGLLHLLESHTYAPIGHTSAPTEAQVRFIVGTNADLEQAVAEGRFLEDLYFRVNVLPVRVPPLAERLDEIPPWVAFMLDRRHKKAGFSGPISASAAAVQLLVRQPWPGNLRQLHNIVRRAYAITLAEEGDPTGPVVVQLHHVQRALSLGKATQDQAPARGDGVLPAMEAAALQLLDEARRRSGWGGTLDLSIADLFSSLVIYLAYRETGDVRLAYERVGREALVKSRSHFKDFRRRMSRVQELYEALGMPVDEPLRQALEL